MVRPASAFVHGTEGPVTVVPGRVAAWLERQCGLGRLRVEVRGFDPEVDAVLTALAVAAAAWRSMVCAGSDVGTVRAELSEPDAPLGVMTTTSAARRADRTPRAITKAIADGRLKARRPGGVWLIEPEDFAHYLAARSA